MGGLLLFNSLRAMIYKFYWERPDGQGHVYDEKFIIAVVEDQEGESEIHFVTIPLAYHSDIFGSYKMKLEAEQGKTVKSVMGGGIVSIDAKEKVLKTYGKSGGFGAVTINIVEKCLRETIAHQGYTFT